MGGDTASTVPVGMLDERTKGLLRTTENALRKAIASASEECGSGMCVLLLREEAVGNGVSVVREFVGHGVGRKLHEEPQFRIMGKRGAVRD